MDSKGFRLAQSPFFMAQPSARFVKQETTREIEATKTVPAPDSRFRAQAAPMADGRLVTDYRQACVTRAPPGAQFATKQWTVHNTDDIIRISRERQVQNTGQALGTAATELPPAELQNCSVNSCKFSSSGQSGGVGIERTDKAPLLFGTFDFPPSYATESKNREFTALNGSIEQGRNTPSRWSHLQQ